MVNMPQPLSYVLNFMRWFAAFFVVIGHLRSLLFVEYDKVDSVASIDKLFYFLTGFGHEAVIVFFVLSGYLVGGEFLKIVKANRTLKEYFIKRFSRIFVVFVPAIIIGGALDLVGSYWFNYNGIYENAFHLSTLNYSVVERLSIDVLLINLGMMQTSLGPTFGSNGPLWSLANEWWYYMLPLLLFLLYKSQSVLIRLISVCVIMFLLYILNTDIILYFIIWLMGMFFTLVRIRVSLYLFPVLMFFILLTFTFSRFHIFNISAFYYDIFIALAIGSFIVALSEIDNNRLFVTRTNSTLADFSYSLYLFHFPFILLLVSILGFYTIDVARQPNIQSYSIFMVIVLFTYIYSYIMHWLFEARTKKIRNKLISWIK